MNQTHAGRVSGLVVRQPHCDRCYWLGRARVLRGQPLVHVAVHALHGHIPASIHDHFTTILDHLLPFGIHGAALAHARCVAGCIRVPLPAS